MNTLIKTLPGIQFPVFSFFQVSDYELFPGKYAQGLNHSFKPGVTVVAGINGIGKTTLLNMMLRILVGPKNPEGLNPLGVGGRSHELVGWNNRSYFSSRVSDQATNATMYAELTIGQNSLKIKRKLNDLSIIELVLNGTELEASEAEYEYAVLSSTNAATMYDFDYLVRHLVFFLEQRTPLFWNERGQIEAFRILLCDSILANSFQELQDEIQQKDSLYRNLRWNANKRANLLKNEQKRLATSSDDTRRAEAIESERDGLLAQISDWDQGLKDTAEKQSEIRTKILLQKIELEEELRHYEGLQQSYFAQIFPTLDEAAQTVFRSLLSGNGCIVCGNRDSEKSLRVKHLLEHHQCPVCESLPIEQERTFPENPEHSKNELLAIGTRIERLQKSIATLEPEEKKLGAQLTKYTELRINVEPDLLKLNNDLAKINSRTKSTPEAIRSLKEVVERETNELITKEGELQTLYAKFEKNISQVNDRVNSIETAVREKFAEYAQSFLEEKCFLSLSNYKGKVGQEKTFIYPCFDVYMTSATSPNRETKRSIDSDVSESQKEFIDLAFRMALIASVSTLSGKAMLVIETPEASLDTYFVDQAGKLLRNFGNSDSQSGNVVIVSSNLNRQNMIPALLGLTGPKEEWPNKTEIQDRLINLLEEAGPNAALRARRDVYQTEFNRATQQLLTNDVQ